jgi:hypothetical protein
MAATLVDMLLTTTAEEATGTFGLLAWLSIAKEW